MLLDVFQFSPSKGENNVIFPSGEREELYDLAIWLARLQTERQRKSVWIASNVIPMLKESSMSYSFQNGTFGGSSLLFLASPLILSPTNQLADLLSPTTNTTHYMAW